MSPDHAAMSERRFTLLRISVVVFVGACLVAGCAWLLLQQRELDRTRAALVRAHEAVEASAVKRRSLEHRIEELGARIDALTRESAVKNAVEHSESGVAKDPPALHPPERLTVALVEARYQRARTLAKNGNNAEALTEFLWCYDTGMAGVSRYGGVRGSFLLMQIAGLGESYAPALEALRLRRDQLLDAMLFDPDDSEAFSDFSSLNRALKDDASNLALFEKLPAGDNRRGMLGLGVYDTLVSAQRYAEALEAQPYNRMASLFEALIETRPSSVTLSEKQIDQMRRSALRSGARGFEALVGAGRVEQASEFAAKILSHDASDDTRQLLRDAAARSGNPDFKLP